MLRGTRHTHDKMFAKGQDRSVNKADSITAFDDLGAIAR